jgi:hypothetical protein
MSASLIGHLGSAAHCYRVDVASGLALRQLVEQRLGLFQVERVTYAKLTPLGLLNPAQRPGTAFTPAYPVMRVTDSTSMAVIVVG